MGHLKKLTLSILALLQSVNAALSQPAPPDTVVAVPYQAEDQGSFILMTWDAVERADGYRIYREVSVNYGRDEQGNVVEVDTRLVLLPWLTVEAMEPVVRVIVATLDRNTNTRWAVTTVRNTDDGPVESEPVYFHVQGEGGSNGSAGT